MHRAHRFFAVVLLLGGCPSAVENEPPVARLRTPQLWEATQPVTLDATASTDADGIIARYTYLFGDGTPEEILPHSSVQHVFPGPGNFEVEVTVEDDDGATGSIRRHVVLVDVLAPPYCAADADCGDAGVHCETDAGVCFDGP
ncbi:MAG: PKD domain-containing protein [Deltaproteobacteria bacterium]|nr:PKD domain-containing protein [Deltaproteobacteria bacterium]